MGWSTFRGLVILFSFNIVPSLCEYVHVRVCVCVCVVKVYLNTRPGFVCLVNHVYICSKFANLLIRFGYWSFHKRIAVYFENLLDFETTFMHSLFRIILTPPLDYTRITSHTQIWDSDIFVVNNVDIRLSICKITLHQRESGKKHCVWAQMVTRVHCVLSFFLHNILHSAKLFKEQSDITMNIWNRLANSEFTFKSKHTFL